MEKGENDFVKGFVKHMDKKLGKDWGFKWIEFRERPTLPNRKTKKFNVYSKCSKTDIGTISWYPQWRHYCFFPEGWTVYTDRCLLTISHFITKLNEEYAQKGGNRKDETK